VVDLYALAIPPNSSSRKTLEAVLSPVQPEAAPVRLDEDMGGAHALEGSLLLLGMTTATAAAAAAAAGGAGASTHPAPSQQQRPAATADVLASLVSLLQGARDVVEALQQKAQPTAAEAPAAAAGSGGGSAAGAANSPMANLLTGVKELCIVAETAPEGIPGLLLDEAELLFMQVRGVRGCRFCLPFCMLRWSAKHVSSWPMHVITLSAAGAH
jgi:hypothetical protein